jgi:hypothetical protein
MLQARLTDPATWRPSRKAACVQVDKERGPVLAMSPRAPGAEAEDRTMTKSTSRKAAMSTARVKTAVTISAEAYRRLRAACAAEDLEQGELIELMINRLLSGYVVSIRGERIVPVEGKDRAEGEPEAKRPGPAAA